MKPFFFVFNGRGDVISVRGGGLSVYITENNGFFDVF